MDVGSLPMKYFRRRNIDSNDKIASAALLRYRGISRAGYPEYHPIFHTFLDEELLAPTKRKNKHPHTWRYIDLNSLSDSYFPHTCAVSTLASAGDSGPCSRASRTCTSHVKTTVNDESSSPCTTTSSTCRSLCSFLQTIPRTGTAVHHRCDVYVPNCTFTSF